MKVTAKDLLKKLKELELTKITIYQEIGANSFSESLEIQPITESYETIKGSNAKARFDRGSDSTRTTNHYHVLIKGREAFAVNVDGTAHHGSNKGIRVNNTIADFLRGRGVALKSDNILESYEFVDEYFYRVFETEV